MALTTAMKTALATPRAMAWVLDLTLPADAGGPMHLSDVPVVGTDYYSPRVIQWSAIPYMTSDRGGNLQAVTTTVRITDLPEPGSSYKTGPFARATKLASLKWSAATIRAVCEGAGGFANASTFFTGALERWERSGETDWTLYLRVDDRPLQRPCPQRVLSAADWPAAFRPTGDGSDEDAVIGKRAPVVMGDIDSTGLGANGLRKAWYVDTVRFRYLVSLGEIGATGFVAYVNGIVASPQPTRELVTIGGCRWTVITFTTDQADAKVTVDCQGIDLGSYGTFTNPANQGRFFLENLVFRNWNGYPSAIAAAGTYTDASWATLATAMAALEGAPVLGGSAAPTGAELLRQFNAGYNAVTWYTDAGKIGAGLWSSIPTARGGTIYSNVVVPEMPDILELGLKVPAETEVLEAADLGYLPGPDGQPQQSISVVHPRKIPPMQTDSRVCTWGPARVL